MDKTAKRYYIIILVGFFIGFINISLSEEPIISLKSLSLVFVLFLLVGGTIFFILKKYNSDKQLWKNKLSSGNDVIFYESKTQYYVFSFILFFVSLISIFWTNLGFPFLGISTLFLIFLFFYPVAKITINNKDFSYSRQFFKKKIVDNWSNVTDIIFDPKPGAYERGFKSGDFYIKTGQKLLGPIDTLNIKIKDNYTLKSQGDNLVETIENLSGKKQRFSKSSDFPSVFSDKKNIFIILGLVILIVAFYFLLNFVL